MTPEERAAAIIPWLGVRLVDEDDATVQDIDSLLDEIAAAIRAAVEAERERCARIAEEEATICRRHIGWDCGEASTAVNIAGRIRVFEERERI